MTAIVGHGDLGFHRTRKSAQDLIDQLKRQGSATALRKGKDRMRIKVVTQYVGKPDRHGRYEAMAKPDAKHPRKETVYYIVF